jgi:hypothetical protein
MNNKGFTLTELIFSIATICIFGVFFGGLYVIGHFIAKFW